MTNRNEIDHANPTGIGYRIGHVLRDVLVGLDALNRIQNNRPWERVARDAARRPDGPRVVKH